MAKFAAATCRSCPARAQCTTSARGRQPGIPPQDLYELQAAARAAQTSQDWQDDYKRPGRHRGHHARESR
jgi:hypothetical protein